MQSLGALGKCTTASCSEGNGIHRADLTGPNRHKMLGEKCPPILRASVWRFGGLSNVQNGHIIIRLLKTNKNHPGKTAKTLVIWILPLNVKPCWSLKKVVRFVSPRHRLAIAETCSCIPKRALRKCWKGQLSSGQAQNQMPFERDQINIKSWSNHSFQL